MGSQNELVAEGPHCMAAWHCGSKTYLQYWVGKHYVAWWLLQPPEKRYEHLLVHRIAPDTMKNKTIFQTTTFSTFGSALLWSAKAALFTTKRYGSPGEIVILTGNSSRSISLDCLLYGLVGKMHHPPICTSLATGHGTARYPACMAIIWLHGRT